MKRALADVKEGEGPGRFASAQSGVREGGVALQPCTAIPLVGATVLW